MEAFCIERESLEFVDGPEQREGQLCYRTAVSLPSGLKLTLTHYYFRFAPIIGKEFGKKLIVCQSIKLLDGNDAR